MRAGRSCFCPLQGIEFALVFRWARRTRNGAGRKVATSDFFGVVCFLSASLRAVAVPAHAARDAALTNRTDHRGITT
jgi:hypothetical protein